MRELVTKYYSAKDAAEEHIAGGAQVNSVFKKEGKGKGVGKFGSIWAATCWWHLVWIWKASMNREEWKASRKEI